MTAPQLSIQLRTFSETDLGAWPSLLDQARAADEAGIDRIVVSDHVVYGEQLDAYGDPKLGGAAGGRQPTGPDGHWLEPLTVLSVLTGITSRVRLGTNILLAALRTPAVLAKTAATIDVLSGGRLDLGVGVGWQREEYEASGLRFEDRGRLLDRTLAVCQALWTEPIAAFDDGELQFEKIHMMPKPHQAGGVPIWVSGTVNALVARRLATYGSTWIPWGSASADLAGSVTQLRSMVEAAGGDPSFGVVGNLAAARTPDGEPDAARTMAGVPALLAAGVTDVRLGIVVPADRAAAFDLLSAFVTEFRSATA